MFGFKVLTKCDKTCSSVAMTITFIVQFLQSGYRVVCTDGHMSLCGLDQIVFSFLVAIVVNCSSVDSNCAVTICTKAYCSMRNK